MTPETFERALRRYDPDLRLRFGLHPRDKRRIDVGIDVPYNRRRMRFVIYRLDPNTGQLTDVHPIETPEGEFRYPYEMDLRWVYDHDLYKWTKGRRKPTKWQMDRIEGEFLKEDWRAERKAKEDQDRLEYWRKEVAPATKWAINKDTRGNV